MSSSDKPNATLPWDIAPNTSRNGPTLCATPPNSPWGAQSAASLTYIHQVIPFEEVMSEQLATHLQVKEETSAFPSLNVEECTTAPTTGEDELADDTTKSDALIAQALQAQFDQEYNTTLQSRESQANKNSKVKISYAKYRTDDMFVEDELSSDYDDDEIVLAPNDVRNTDPSSGTDQLVFNRKGYTKFGKEVITKHDAEISGRRNTARFEDSMPPDFHTGDTRGMDLLLSNRNYNQLKRHAKQDQKRSSKLRENKDISTAEHALDDQTKKILNRMVDRGFISEVYGVISKGKEAVVLHADAGEGVDEEEAANSRINHHNTDFHALPVNLPEEIAIKVYQTTLCEYKSRDKYIKDDFRFKDRYKKLNDHKIIYLWAEKEMHNLNRIRESGIPCPRVVLLKKHILLMSFVGENCKSAPQLRVARLSQKQRLSAYNQVVEIMKKLYHECRLVHGDLSEYNLLWHQDKVWVIDVSQSVEPNHPYALEYLHRDCKNICVFFQKLKVPNVLEPMQLFNHVSGLDIPEDDEQGFMIRCEEIGAQNYEHSMKRRNAASKLLANPATSTSSD